MELDEFKTYWKSGQEKELDQQKYSTDTINSIIMNATNTLGQLHQKSIYWNKIGKPIFITAIIALLIDQALWLFWPSGNKALGTTLPFVLIMIVFMLVSLWVYNYQQQLFVVNPAENLKDGLKTIVTKFKRFYVWMNVIYLVLYPLYFYAVIKLFGDFLSLSATTIWMIVAAVSVIFLVAGHIYYKMKYLDKIKALEANIAELENGQGA